MNIFQKKKKHLFLRDTLAVERTELANERTLYAGIRTSLTLFIVGITMIKLINTSWIQTAGWGLIAGSVLSFVYMLFRFFALEKILKKSEK